MGKRVENFKKALTDAGFGLATAEQRQGETRAHTRDLPLVVRTEIAGLYRGLGGMRDDADFTAGAWDIATTDGLFIEFDEELHFNRYRERTLHVPWAGRLPWSGAYRHFSTSAEGHCLRACQANGWANPSTDRMFGGSDRKGSFLNLGSSRWKQRALYDAVRDSYALHTPGIRLARVSIFDRIGGLEVGKAMKDGTPLDPVALRDFITARTIGSLQPGRVGDQRDQIRDRTRNRTRDRIPEGQGPLVATEAGRN
jgi:hypothetical protein